MNKIFEILFSALRSALFGGEVNTAVYQNLSAEEWAQLFRLAAHQGVVAIVYDVVSKLPENCQPPRAIKIQWALSTEAIEQRYKHQFIGAKSLSDKWSEANIKTVVFKGFSLSKYYPIPNHRECGDFDCYLLDGRYEDGNILAEQIGANVNREWYKHSQIYYRGMMAENHNLLVTTREGKLAKELDAILTEMLQGDLQPLEGTNILLPTTQFTALFVTYHSFSHFISEGITLRHMCDWACFMKAEQNNFDWDSFYVLCNKFKFNRFVDVSNEIITKYLGITLQNKSIVCETPYTNKVLKDILMEDAKVFSSGKGKWHNRIKLIKNIFSYRWKYSDIAQSSSILYFLKLTLGYLLKRETH